MDKQMLQGYAWCYRCLKLSNVSGSAVKIFTAVDIKRELGSFVQNTLSVRLF
jgi:hypothetical protein